VASTRCDARADKIKVIKRRCYGLLNRNHLFQRLYLDLFGYALYGPRNNGLAPTPLGSMA